MKGKSFLALMVALMLLVWLIVNLTSCYTPKKAEKQVSKAMAFYPEIPIGKVRILAPCVTGGSSFSTDSAAYKQSIDSLYNSKAWYEALIRGIETLPEHPKEQDTICPELSKRFELAQKELDYKDEYIIDLTDQFNNLKPVEILRVDTVLDKSETVLLELKLQDADKMYKQQTQELSNIKQERDKAKKASNKKTWWMVGEGLLALLLGAALFFILKGKATTKLA